jgi:endonuclease III
MKAHETFEELIPLARYSRMHLNFIRLGREVCVAGVPRREIYWLTDVCEYY